MSRQTVTEAVERALDAVGMQDFVYQPTSSLSGGQKQRVTLAGALAQEAQVCAACVLPLVVGVASAGVSLSVVCESRAVVTAAWCWHLQLQPLCAAPDLSTELVQLVRKQIAHKRRHSFVSSASILLGCAGAAAGRGDDLRGLRGPAPRDGDRAQHRGLPGRHRAVRDAQARGAAVCRLGQLYGARPHLGLRHASCCGRAHAPLGCKSVRLTWWGWSGIESCL